MLSSISAAVHQKCFDQSQIFWQTHLVSNTGNINFNVNFERYRTGRAKRKLNLLRQNCMVFLKLSTYYHISYFR
jgi:hypothetical protein